MKRKSLLLVIALLATSGANAGVVDDLLRQYQAQASQPFDAERAIHRTDHSLGGPAGNPPIVGFGLG